VGLVNLGIGRRGIGGSVGIGPLRAGTGISYRQAGKDAAGRLTPLLWCAYLSLEGADVQSMRLPEGVLLGPLCERTKWWPPAAHRSRSDR